MGLWDGGSIVFKGDEAAGFLSGGDGLLMLLRRSGLKRQRLCRWPRLTPRLDPRLPARMTAICCFTIPLTPRLDPRWQAKM